MAVTTADGYHSDVRMRYAVMGSSPDNPDSTGADEALPVELPEVETDLWEVLHHFSEALAIVETVSHALQAAENSEECQSIGAEVATLRQGVDALITVHEELDLAITGVAS
jgi:hypothetical protein